MLAIVGKLYYQRLDQNKSKANTIILYHASVYNKIVKCMTDELTSLKLEYEIFLSPIAKSK